MAELFAIEIESFISDDVYKGLLNAVSEKRRQKISRYHFEMDAKRSLYASTLVRYLACTKLNIINENIRIIQNQYGKPYFNGIPNQFFNISHSGKWVVCAWSQQEIGVDVEIIRDVDLGIIKRFFCKSEYFYLLDKNKEKQKEQFFDLWTLKESYIKYKGSGLMIPLNSFRLDIESGSIKLISEDLVKPFFYKFNIDENHKLAVCTNDSEVFGVTFISPKTIWSKLCNKI